MASILFQQRTVSSTCRDTSLLRGTRTGVGRDGCRWGVSAHTEFSVLRPASFWGRRTGLTGLTHSQPIPPLAAPTEEHSTVPSVVGVTVSSPTVLNGSQCCPDFKKRATHCMACHSWSVTGYGRLKFLCSCVSTPGPVFLPKFS